MAGFIVSLSAIQANPQARPGWVVGILVASYLAVTIALKLFDTKLAMKRLNSSGAASGWGRVLSTMISIIAQLWIIMGPVAVLMLGFAHWVWIDLNLRSLPLIGEIATLVPFIAALIIFWTMDYPCHIASRQLAASSDIMMGRLPKRIWTFRQYLIFNIRTHLLFLAVPIGLMILLSDCISLYLSPAVKGFFFGEYLVMGLSIAIVPLVFILAPVLIVRIWQTRPIKTGPLKDDLDAMSKKFSLRFRQLRLWCSGGVVANAAMLGFVGKFRYILLSDAMIDNMEPDQVKAVFAHEAGHIVHHHIPAMVLFLISSMLLATAAVGFIDMVIPLDDWSQAGAVTTLLIAFFAGFFGWMSRRFERQADVLAAWASGPEPAENENPDRISPEGAEMFATALENIAMLNNMSLHKHNWRHGAIAWRVQYIRSLAQRGGSRREINQLVKRIMLCLLASLTAGIAMTLILEFVL